MKIIIRSQLIGVMTPYRSSPRLQPCPTSPSAAVIYCFLGRGGLLGLWLYYDRREHTRFELERRKATFHCIRCNHLYIAPLARSCTVARAAARERAAEVLSFGSPRLRLL